MKRISNIGAAVAATSGLMLAGAGQAAERGQFTFNVFGAYEPAIAGDVHGSASPTVPDLGVLNTDLAGTPGTLDIGSRSYSDIYDGFYSVGAEAGYFFTDMFEGLFRVAYTEASGDRVQAGTIPDVVTIDGTPLDIFGDFGDYSALNVEAGGRYYAFPEQPFRPFVGGSVGVSFVDEIRASFTVPNADIALNDIAFYDDGSVLTAALQAGIAWTVAPGWDVVGEVGVRYAEAPDGDDEALASLGLQDINDEGERWTVPLQVRLQYRF